MYLLTDSLACLVTSSNFISHFLSPSTENDNSFENGKSSLKSNFHDSYYISSDKAHGNGSLTNSRYGYGWFEEDQLASVAMIRHSPSGAGKLNYLQHDKLNAPVSAAQITVEQTVGKKRENENIFLVIVPVTIGIVIAVILFSLISYLKKMPDIPDLTDQCLIVQQIKPSEKTMKSAQSEPEEASPQNLITNPFEDLDIDEILKSTLKLAKAPSLNQQTSQTISHTNTIAQLNEIYHPVVKGPHTHSHLLIKPSSSYSTLIPSSVLTPKETNYLNEDQSCEAKQPRHNHHNLSTFYLNNKAQLDYEASTFATQNWPVNCCETCPCNQQTHPHRAPD